jgi:hypothetical protein
MYIDINLNNLPKTSTVTSTGTIPINPINPYNNTTSPITRTITIIEMLAERITRLEKQLDMSNIAILAAMQKFTKEECENLKKMLDSNDPASVELAKTIIEESLCQ